MAKAWSAVRLASYRAKCYKYIKQQSEQSLCRRVMSKFTDPVQIKARVMAKKLIKVAKLQPIFDEVKKHSEVEWELRERS